MQKIIWEVEATSLPKAVRYCKKCHMKTEYISSGLFRINAQQRCLDIWLIYKCSKCNSTWKLTIYSRISQDAISAELLEQFYNNDKELATRYATDTALLKKCGSESGRSEYRIVGDDIDFTMPVNLFIRSKYPTKLKVAKILRKKLNVSSGELDRLIASGVIKSASEGDLWKCKLLNEIELEISCYE